MTKSPTYGDFVEAMRQKQVFGEEGGTLFEISRLERRRNWAISNYDFGRLLDPTFAGNLRSRLPRLGSRIDVPLKDRAFLFTFGVERQLLVQRFGINTYADDDGGHRFWFYTKAPEGPWLSKDGERGWWEPLVFEATYLLANPHFIDVTPSRASVGKANERRRLSGAAPVPATGIISLTRARRLGAAATGNGLGQPKRPHERVSHERRLRDGRVVSVRACEIHKGCRVPPQSLVVRP
jgi:hypothetical protein